MWPPPDEAFSPRFSLHPCTAVSSTHGFCFLSDFFPISTFPCLYWLCDFLSPPLTSTLILSMGVAQVFGLESWWPHTQVFGSFFLFPPDPPPPPRPREDLFPLTTLFFLGPLSQWDFPGVVSPLRIFVRTFPVAGYTPVRFFFRPFSV